VPEGQVGKDFTGWDPEGYKNKVINQFMCYLAAAGRVPIIVSRICAEGLGRGRL
jgi:hypothetical protein